MPAALLLRLLGLGRWLREAATALLGLVRRYPLQAAIIALLCLSGWLWRQDHRHIAQRDAAIAGRAADRAAYVKAQTEAVAKQLAADQTTFHDHLSANERLDHDHPALDQARRDGVAAYISLHKAAGGASCRASEAGVPGDPRPAPDAPQLPDTVAVPRRDLEAFSEVELHDSEAVTFLQRLYDDGLAVKASEVEAITPAFGS